MIYKPPGFESCFGKKLPFPPVNIEGTYECGKCWRKNARLHPATPDDAPCTYIEPWPDFTPCQNFLPLKWSAPLSDDEIKQMLQIPLPRWISQEDCNDAANFGMVARSLLTSGGWTEDDKFDYELKIKRQLVADAIIHELQRRAHELPTPRLRPLHEQPTA
jgi:hypothetical protein